MVWFFRKLFDISVADTRRNTYIALIAVTFYLLHPAMAETVNYVIARADLQSTLAVILAFVMYQYSARCRKFYLYLIPIIIGALAKPPAIMFAPLFFIYVLLFDEKVGFYYLFKKAHFKQLLSAIAKSAPAFICCLLMYWLQAKLTPKTWEPGGTSPWAYLITQPFVILHYFQMFFVPNALSADSDWQLLPNILNWRFFAGTLFILAMLAVAFITSQKARLRPISFGILWFFIALIPTSSIIPLAEVLNDHRMFFPFVGLMISVSWPVALLADKYRPTLAKYVPQYKTIAIIMLCVMLTSYAYATFRRNEVWYTEETLWHDVTIKSPKNGRGLMNYGLARMTAGDYETADKYFERALKLMPYYSTLYINVAILKAATGHNDIAEINFKKALLYGGNYPDTYVYYGRFLNAQGRYADAAANLQKAMALSPANLYARALLMDVYQNTENWDALKNLSVSTLQLAPDNEDAKKYLDAANAKKSKIDDEAAAISRSPTADKYLTLSLRYYNIGKFEQCIDACKKALALKPDYGLAYNNICASYNKLGQWDKAIAAGEKGLKIIPDNQLLKNNLRESYSHGAK